MHSEVSSPGRNKLHTYLEQGRQTCACSELFSQQTLHSHARLLRSKPIRSNPAAFGGLGPKLALRDPEEQVQGQGGQCGLQGINCFKLSSVTNFLTPSGAGFEIPQCPSACLHQDVSSVSFVRAASRPPQQRAVSCRAGRVVLAAHPLLPSSTSRCPQGCHRPTLPKSMQQSSKDFIKWEEAGKYHMGVKRVARF